MGGAGEEEGWPDRKSQSTQSADTGRESDGRERDGGRGLWEAAGRPVGAASVFLPEKMSSFITDDFGGKHIQKDDLLKCSLLWQQNHLWPLFKNKSCQ